MNERKAEYFGSAEAVQVVAVVMHEMRILDVRMAHWEFLYQAAAPTNQTCYETLAKNRYHQQTKFDDSQRDGLQIVHSLEHGPKRSTVP